MTFRGTGGADAIQAAALWWEGVVARSCLPVSQAPSPSVGQGGTGARSEGDELTDVQFCDITLSQAIIRKRAGEGIVLFVGGQGDAASPPYSEMACLTKSRNCSNGTALSPLSVHRNLPWRWCRGVPSCR